MSQVTSRAQINVYINEGSAVASMKKLDSQYAKIVQKQLGLQEGSKKWQKLEEQKKEIVAQYDKLAKSIDITKLNLQDLQSEQKRLNGLLSKVDYGTKGYQQLQKELTAVNGRIKEVKTGLGPFAQAWTKLKTELLSVQGIFMGLLAGGFLTSQIVGFIKSLGDLDDQLADIQKTTGMSAQEVEELNKRFGQIDTRTSKKDLREMAIVLGQMGYSKDDIFQTAAAVDKLAVALSDEFSGGAAEVAGTMGKLRNVLTDMRTGDAADDMLKLGNALNVLGAEGIATGPIVAEFANRIGGVGITFGMTSGQVLGLSAAMQEMNISAERGSTAVVGILQKMTTHTKEFAHVAGMSVEAFTEMVNNDIYGAFIKVSKGAAENAQSATQLGELLKDLSADGARVSEVFTKVGNNTQLVADKVATATKALGNTESIMAEFAIKNNTLGAQIQKLEKDFYKLFANEDIKKGVIDLVKGLSNLLKALKDNAGTIVVMLRVVGSLIVSWGTYKLVTMANTDAVKGFGKALIATIELLYLQVKNLGAANTASGVYKQGMFSLNAAFTSLKGSVKSLWAAFLENPLGWIAAGFSLIYTLVQQFGTSIKSTSDVLKELNEVRKQFGEDAAKEVGEIRALFDALRRVKPESQEFIRLKQELNDKYGVTLENYSKELGYLDQLERAENKLIGAQLKKLAIKSKDEEISKIYSQIFNLEKERLELETKIPNASTAYFGKGDDGGGAGSRGIKNAKQSMIDRVTEIGKELVELNDEIGNVIGTTDVLLKTFTEKYDNKMTSAQELLWDQGVGATMPGAKNKSTTPEGPKKKNTGTYVPLDDDKTRKSVDFQISEIKRLNDAVHGFQNDIIKSGYGAGQKEMFDLQERYDSEIKLARDTYKLIQKELKRSDLKPEEREKLVKSGEELLKLEVEIEELRWKAVIIKRKEIAEKRLNNTKETWEKQIKLSRELAEKNAKARSEAWEKYEEATVDSDEREKIQITRKFDGLVELAQKYGWDTVALEEQRAKAMAEIRNKEINKGIAEFEKYYSAVGNLASAALQFTTNSENSDLANFKASNERKKSIYQKQLDLKLISEEKFKEKTAKLDEDYSKKERELKKQQFERQKGADVISSLINTAVGVTKALASAPPPMNFILAAAVGGAGLLQTGAILAQPTPEFKIGGTVVDGPSHEQGGINLANRKGKVIGNMEGGEAIWSRATVKKNPRITKYMLNASMFNNGDTTVLEKMLTKYPNLDLAGALHTASSMPIPTFSVGGITNDRPITNSNSTATTGGMTSADAQMLIGKFDEMITAIRDKNNEPVEAKIVYSKWEVASKNMNKIRELAAFKWTGN